MKIGILGGSFDPVHNGHLELAEKAAAQIGFDLLYFVPASAPPHKKHSFASALHRMRMLELAVNNRAGFSVSDYEVCRGGITYTYETLEYFRSLYPAAELFFIVGQDSAADIKNWRFPEKIVSMARIVSGNRKPAPPDCRLPGGGDYIQLSGEIADISSTEVRRKIKNAEPVEGLIPEEVKEYIEQNGLYR